MLCHILYCQNNNKLTFKRYMQSLILYIKTMQNNNNMILLNNYF